MSIYGNKQEFASHVIIRESFQNKYETRFPYACAVCVYTAYFFPCTDNAYIGNSLNHFNEYYTEKKRFAKD